MNMRRRTGASAAGGGGMRLATGIYTGDGAATQAIAGLGFQPKLVWIYGHANVGGGILLPFGMKIPNNGLFAQMFFVAAPDVFYKVDMIISLDAGGFTVGDGTGYWNVFNSNAIVYTYIAFA